MVPSYWYELTGRSLNDGHVPSYSLHSANRVVKYHDSHFSTDPDTRPDRLSFTALSDTILGDVLRSQLRSEPQDFGVCNLELDQNQIDLWYVFSDKIDDAELLEEYHELLAPDEIEQWQRFRVERVRHQYLVTRALVRSVLSRYGGVAPRAWVFRRNAYGKPAVQEPAMPGLEFNLSHTEGLVICGVTRCGEIGVDVERVDRRVEHRALAQRFFAPSESTVLTKAPADHVPGLFFELWTLKESYIKARGMGLSIPLDDFAFEVHADRPPQIRFAKPGLDDPAGWQFWRCQIASAYQMAIAAHVPAREPIRLRLWATVPLRNKSEPYWVPPSESHRWTVFLPKVSPQDHS
jgi:4'-phosphopantetheinyl transferase